MGMNAWHRAVYCCNVDVMQKIWELAKERLTREGIKKLLLRPDGKGWDAWRIETFGGKVDLIQKICELTKETLTREELKNEMLLRTDGGARNALQISASMVRLDVMQILWELAK